jgi:hypothetical protein
MTKCRASMDVPKIPTEEAYVVCPGTYNILSCYPKTQVSVKRTTLATSLYESLVCVGLIENIPLNAAGILTDPPNSRSEYHYLDTWI